MLSIICALSECGFDLTKIRSNCSTLRTQLGSTETDPIIGDIMPHEAALGISWDLSTDELLYGSEDFLASTKVSTKRSLLSAVMSLWDPLGHMVPFITPLKILMQSACCLDPPLKWDDALPESLQHQVDRAVSGLLNVRHVRIPRHYSPMSSQIVRRELHSFSDGSSRAYGANVYLRQVDINGRITCSLVIAKNRVAPARKALTIPRTELCGAVVAADLATVVQREIPEKIDQSGFLVRFNNHTQIYCKHAAALSNICRKSHATHFRAYPS